MRLRWIPFTLNKSKSGRAVIFLNKQTQPWLWLLQSSRWLSRLLLTEQKSNARLARTWRRCLETLWRVSGHKPTSSLNPSYSQGNLSPSGAEKKKGEGVRRKSRQKKGGGGRKDEIAKGNERTLLLSFFSCLTQLSDFAFKFKTVDQTARGTLYFCQETIWYLSVALLHASNTEPCLSVGPAYGAMCRKIAKFISDCTHGCCPGFTALYQFKKKKANHDLIITFHK